MMARRIIEKLCTPKLLAKEGATEAIVCPPPANSASVFANSELTFFAFCGQTLVHVPQRMQRSPTICAWRFSNFIAFTGHSRKHLKQSLHRAGLKSKYSICSTVSPSISENEF
jgi:hypothetical protein